MRAAGRSGFRGLYWWDGHPVIGTPASPLELAFLRYTPALSVAIIALAGCAAQITKPPDPPQVVTVNVPVPVLCFDPVDRPKLPDPTLVNPETATTEQLAAAELADAIKLRDYAAVVDRLFEQCSKAI